MADLKHFPSLNEVKSKIEKFNSFQWPSFEQGSSVDEYVEKVSKIFTSEFNVLPDILEFLNLKEFPLRIFRAREVNSFNDINLLCEHSYSPRGLTRLNRCNFPNYPVFYCSNNGMTALCEVAKGDTFQGKKYCISRWAISQSTEDVLIQPYLFGDIHADNIFIELQKTLVEKIKEIFENKLNEEQEEGLKLYLKYMADLFINDNSYNLSAFFSHRRLYATHNYKTEILIYPSVQNLKKGVNMAIHPNFVDSKMYPVRFYIVGITNLDRTKGNINLEFYNYGVMERSQIKWFNLTMNDIEYKNNLKEDFDFEGTIDLEYIGPKV